MTYQERQRLSDHLAHRYFDTTHAILQATVEHDLPELESAVVRLSDAPADGTDDEPLRRG